MGRAMGSGQSSSREQVKGSVVMDEFDLIQEAVSNWESLYEIEVVDTCELPSPDAEGRLFLARIMPRGEETPLYIEMRTLGRVDIRLEESFDRGKPVSWSQPGYSLN